MTSLEEAKQQRNSLLPGFGSSSKWAKRFIWAAVAQGLIAAIATVLIVEPQSYLGINWYFSPAKVIVSGGGGTWMFTGYIL